MDICHKSHITQQSHEIDKKLHYDEPTLHYPLNYWTYSTLPFYYYVREYLQEYSQTIKQNPGYT